MIKSSTTQESHENNKLKIYIMYLEDLGQTCVVPVLAVSISVSSYGLCSIGSEDCFLESSICSGAYILSASTSVELPELWREGFDGTITFRAECSKLSLYLWEWVSEWIWVWCKSLAVFLCIYLPLLQKKAWKLF